MMPCRMFKHKVLSQKAHKNQSKSANAEITDAIIVGQKPMDAAAFQITDHKKKLNFSLLLKLNKQLSTIVKTSDCIQQGCPTHGLIFNGLIVGQSENKIKYPVSTLH